jgi:SIR2-like domain
MPRVKATAKAIEASEESAKKLLSRIYGDILRQGCVVFVGAGSTTEGRRHDGETFYQRIREIAQVSEESLSFPELMQYFCDQMDGGHHNRLIREALSRLETFCIRGSEDSYFASMFTDSLAEIPYFNRFVTTNWDPFLERSLDVLVPMVEDRDLAFWDDDKRQVLKIHGCITRPYSIVATQSDYDTCARRNPLIFNKMKDLMATKTFLFVGYSMRDPDFQKVWDSIDSALGRFANLAYAVDPNASADQVALWRKRGIEIFRCRDLEFARTLRARLEKEDLIPSEKLLKFLQRERDRIVSIHIRNNQTSDGKFSSAMYQDGLLHQLSSILISTALGTKKKVDFENDYGKKLNHLNKMRRRKDLIEIAYWSGRVEVLRRFNNRQKSPIPAFFHPYRMHPTQKLIKGSSY